MRKADKIFLIGFMGSGKSTAGRKLASRLGWSFTDLDEMIESIEGMAIAEIFSKKGEAYFRMIESETLKGLMNQSRSVISTGGGTPCFSDNMDLMSSNGLTIYLHLTAENLKQRLYRSPTERPLIKNIQKSQLLGFIEAKLAEREKWYNRAELTVDGYNIDISGLYYLIKNKITE